MHHPAPRKRLALPYSGVRIHSGKHEDGYERKVRLLRRLYSTFAGGWPGTGLILMRLVVGFALLADAGPALLSSPPLNVAITSAVLGGTGLLLILGFTTPIAGTMVALVEIFRVITVPADKLTYLLLGTLAASLAMLGPGLWSVDARLFGWKRIEPSPRKRQPSYSQESSDSL
jgi:hypothetical protein